MPLRIAGAKPTHVFRLTAQYEKCENDVVFCILLEDEIMAGSVARVGTTDEFNISSVEIPVSY